MARQEFSTRILVARFQHCGGRCEGILADGRRCNVVLVPGRWQGDHDNPDGLTGQPTFENCRCLCLLCHAEKTKKDVANIARAKRREAAAVGAKRPKGTLRSAGFPRRERAEKLPLPPTRSIYRDTDRGGAK